MQRLALVLSIALLATPLAAQDVRSQIAQQLRAQGYASVDVSKTWLGRLRFQASNGTQSREIIVNPRTGEILRDFLSSTQDGAASGVQILDRAARRKVETGPTERANTPGNTGRSERGQARGPAENPAPGNGQGPAPDLGGSKGPSK